MQLVCLLPTQQPATCPAAKPPAPPPLSLPPDPLSPLPPPMHAYTHAPLQLQRDAGGRGEERAPP